MLKGSLMNPDELPSEDVEDEEAFAAYDRAEEEARNRLLDELAEYQGEDPPWKELAAVSLRLRKQLDATNYPFAAIRRAARFGKTLPSDDRELVVTAVRVTVIPVPPDLELVLTESGGLAITGPNVDELAERLPFVTSLPEPDFTQDDLNLEAAAEDLDFDDWLNLVIGPVKAGPGREYGSTPRE